MYPPCSIRYHFQCCGIQISFFEQCGHTTTEEDHHSACEHLKVPNTYLSSQSARPQPRRLTPPTSSKPEPTLKQPFPQPYPKCNNLHRFINLVDSKCPSCTTAPQIGSWNPNVSKFASNWSLLTQEKIFERGIYWLNEMLRAREEEYQGKLADWEADIENRREVEEAFNVPLLERVFGYDPAGARGDFLTKVAKVGGDRKCGACQGEMGNVMVRRLPCGCVLHLRCVQRWFAVRKHGPCCGVEFKLVKIPKREDSKLQVGEYPIWEDDGYFNFI